MKKDNENHKYQLMGMSIGMCIGVALGASFGSMAGDMAIGMCLGVAAGMMLGMAFGMFMDNRNSGETKVIRDILEDDFGCEGRPEGEEAMVTLVLADKEGREESVRMADKLVYERKLAVGAKVIVAEDGTVKGC